MPSPLAHAVVGYLVYRAFRSRIPQQSSARVRRLPRLLIATTSFSMLPDVDVVAGILLGDFQRFHNAFSNGVTVGLAVALAIGGFVWLKQRSGHWFWFATALVCYELHVLMDFLTIGRGVMLAWPFTSDRFASPVKLFYGLHWSEGFTSPMHLVTLGTELAFLLVVGLIMVLLHRSKLIQRVTRLNFLF